MFTQAEVATAESKIAELNEKSRLHEGIETKADKPQLIERALSACDHVEARPDVGQLRDTRAWVAWVGEYTPQDMLQRHPRVVAARVLRASWCVEFGDGFPCAQCLRRVIESTRRGRTNGLPFFGWLFQWPCASVALPQLILATPNRSGARL